MEKALEVLVAKYRQYKFVLHNSHLCANFSSLVFELCRDNPIILRCVFMEVVWLSKIENRISSCSKAYQKHSKDNPRSRKYLIYFADYWNYTPSY